MLPRGAAARRAHAPTRSSGAIPKILRRVGGYNLDAFVDADAPFNLAKLMVGSEGTLGVVARGEDPAGAAAEGEGGAGDPVRRPARGARGDAGDPRAPAVGGRGDGRLHPRQHQAERRRSIACAGRSSRAIPAALLCVEFYADRAEDLPPRLEALERDLRRARLRLPLPPRARRRRRRRRIWSLREAALGLSMAMKDDAKSLSFVEDTAVAPERLRDYIERFLAIVRAARHRRPASTPTRRSAACTSGRWST